MTVPSNSTSLMVASTLMNMSILMVESRHSQIIGKRLTEDWRNLDRPYHRPIFLMGSLENLNERMHMPSKRNK